MPREQKKLVALIAQQTGDSEDKVAEVLQAEKLIEAAEILAKHQKPHDGDRGEGAEHADRVPDLEPKALKKADSAFGGEDGAGQGEPVFSERSGLLA
jgi:hypothetical protein